MVARARHQSGQLSSPAKVPRVVQAFAATQALTRKICWPQRMNDRPRNMCVGYAYETFCFRAFLTVR